MSYSERLRLIERRRVNEDRKYDRKSIISHLFPMLSWIKGWRIECWKILNWNNRWKKYIIILSLQVSFVFILFLQIYIYRIIILFLQYYLYLHLSVHVIRNEWNKDGPTTKRSKRVKKYIILLWDGSESMKEEEI